MNHIGSKLLALGLMLILLLAACDPSAERETEPNNFTANQSVATAMVESPPTLDTAESEQLETPATPSSAANQEAEVPEPDEMGANSAATLDSWLQQVKDGQIKSEKIEGTLDWSLGFLLAYGSLESLGLDNLIYNALVVQRRLDTGERTQGTLSQSEQNLLEITEGLEYNPDIPLTEQIGQTQEIREAILAHVTASQKNLSPEEALASNNIIGVIGPPAPQSIGNKYLVYIQETPNSDFSFLGVIIAVDASTHSSQVFYNIGGWDSLPWLGDASGPFWEDLPTVSGDRTSTSEGRPGVLLISEETYEQVKAQNFQ